MSIGLNGSRNEKSDSGNSQLIAVEAIEQDITADMAQKMDMRHSFYYASPTVQWKWQVRTNK